MPGKYADDSTSLLLRLPKDLKQRLQTTVDSLNTLHPGANYSVNSVIRTAVIEYLEMIEQQHNIKKSHR